MNTKDIDYIAIVLKEKNLDELNDFYKKIFGKNVNNNIEENLYEIMNEIEKNDELMQYFKEQCIENEELKKLIFFCKKEENIVFFLKNKEIYNFNFKDMIKLEDVWHERYRANYKNKQIEINRKLKVYGLIVNTIIVIFCVMSTFLYAKIYFDTHIVKKAEIIDVEKIYLKNNRIQYSYSVSDVVYYSRQYSFRSFRYLARFRKLINEKNLSDEKVQIYYYIDNPGESSFYGFSFLELTMLILGDIVFIVALCYGYKNIKKKEE